jgi:PAS domain S-box-containing protein
MLNKPTYKELEQRIKELEQTEKSLEDSEMFLSNLLNQSPYPTWIADKNGVMVDTNPALLKVLNLTREQLVGQYNVFDDPQVDKNLLDKIRKVLADGMILDFELEWAGEDTNVEALKDSNRVFIDGTVFPIKNAKGEITNAVITYKDVTDKKIAEQAYSAHLI